MRLWSIHPRYLDAKGLVALWREALLAQKVLDGKTKGYTRHPQLMRFRNTDNPCGAIAGYLGWVADEADSRGYQFDKCKISDKQFEEKIPVTAGQLEYEFTHLLNKLETRDPDRYRRLYGTQEIELHPLFEKVAGKVEDWEVI